MFIFNKLGFADHSYITLDVIAQPVKLNLYQERHHEVTKGDEVTNFGQDLYGWIFTSRICDESIKTWPMPIKFTSQDKQTYKGIFQVFVHYL